MKSICFCCRWGCTPFGLVQKQRRSSLMGHAHPFFSSGGKKILIRNSLRIHARGFSNPINSSSPTNRNVWWRRESSSSASFSVRGLISSHLARRKEAADSPHEAFLWNTFKYAALFTFLSETNWGSLDFTEEGSFWFCRPHAQTGAARERRHISAGEKNPQGSRTVPQRHGRHFKNLFFSVYILKNEDMYGMLKEKRITLNNVLNLLVSAQRQAGGGKDAGLVMLAASCRARCPAPQGHRARGTPRSNYMKIRIYISGVCHARARRQWEFVWHFNTRLKPTTKRGKRTPAAHPLHYSAAKTGGRRSDRNVPFWRGFQNVLKALKNKIK